VRVFVRYGLPALVVVGGILAMALGSDETRWEGGAAIIGAGLAIWLLNLFYRIGAAGDLERDVEERARDYYDRHGRWPDEEPREPTQ
jgi:high-affinity Fe2+/Pb2+ permease